MAPDQELKQTHKEVGVGRKREKRHRKRGAIKKDESVLPLHLTGFEGCHWEGDGSLWQRV